jgi:hypothetical protein
MVDRSMTVQTLYAKLQTARTEEDVKDIYIKALGLKVYSKGLVDISTKEIWFEAKDKGTTSTYKMFTQLLFYVQKTMDKGEHLPPFLAVIDTEKAAIMKTEHALPLLKKKTIKWGKRPSDVSQEALEEVSAFIGTYLVSFRIETHEKEFIETVKIAIKTGDIIRTQITPDNLKQVFDKWVEMIGREIGGVDEDKYNLLFFADIMSDGTVSTHENLPAKLVHIDGQPAFFLDGKMYQLGNKEGYRQFWAIYHRPPEKEYRDYLLERRDSLIPYDERSFKGAYYTPLAVVDKAYDKLSDTLGKNWQREYIVWDMCCGVGNLEVKHSNHRNIFMSTLDQADVDVMHATKTCVAATRFQYDYLNDDINEFGQIDYSLTNKVPQVLRDAIKDGKKILVLINPPYAEAANRGYLAEDVTGKENKKTGVAKTNIAKIMEQYGKAKNELFVQFLARIAKEIPTATLAMFSTLKYVNAPNFEEFRQAWNAKFLDGFVVNSRAFDGLTGKFPIGFLIWQTHTQEDTYSPITSILVDVLDKNASPIGSKLYYNLPKNSYLNVWIDRPKTNKMDVIPIKNAISPATANPRVKTWSDNAIAYMHCGVNDLQHAEQETTLYSSVFSAGNGFYVTPENLWQAAVVFSVRRLIKPTWINDRDQFLQPILPPPSILWEQFKTDCLIWMLFNRCQRTASADGLEWNDRTWSITNHFIPFTETEVGANGRFESDFMVRYLADKTLSPEAQAVLDAGRELWRAYFTQTDPHHVRDELKLNRPDVGWYQIRNALKRRNEAGNDLPVDFGAFEIAYKTLSEKLVPMVYELGFLKI